MKFAMVAGFIATLFFTVFLTVRLHREYAATASVKPVWWHIQSIDTMKYSRDLAREKLGSVSFDTVIDRQMREIRDTGATHVAIATPYDEEFIPMLYRWVRAARKYGLHVWFRGNFSGWEKWFGYQSISRSEHIAKLGPFIMGNPGLFANGDIFTPCPECENGGPGDPRRTGDIAGHRSFLIDEYRTAALAFKDIGVDVSVGYFSMNYDVAKIIMDRETTRTLGNIVTIDHYLKDPAQIARDVRTIAASSGGKIFLGEFGAPIPDLHGKMSESDQSEWIASLLSALARDPDVIGVNYWVHSGGSTQLWSDTGTPRRGVETIRQYFSPKQIIGHVINQYKEPIADAQVATAYKSVYTDSAGFYAIPVLPGDSSLIGSYKTNPVMEVQMSKLSSDTTIVIPVPRATVWGSFIAFIRGLLFR